MKKIIGEFTVKGDGNNSLITVYKGKDMMKGISCNPAQLDDKFKEVCLQVEKHVNNNQSK
jgi:hypothetical protein